MAAYQGGRCNYWQQYSLHAHSHLIGSDCVNHDDLIPSAILCVLFFLAAIGHGVKWHLFVLSRFYISLVLAASMFFTGLAFAIRAGIANTGRFDVPRSAVIAEQFLFILGELILIGSHVTIAYEVVKDQAIARKNWVYINYGLDTVAFTRYSPPPTRPDSISLRGTQLRIAGGVFPFILTVFNLFWLVYEKNKASPLPGLPVLPMMGFSLVVVVDLLLLVPALYAFLVTAVSADDSTLVSSTLWFYIGFGALQCMAALPFAAPLSFFNFSHLPILVVDESMHHSELEQPLINTHPIPPGAHVGSPHDSDP